MNIDYEEIYNEIIEPIVNALTKISEGTVHGPGGLEGVAVSIAGYNLNSPLGESINNVAESINNVSSSIDRITNVMEDFLHEIKKEKK